MITRRELLDGAFTAVATIVATSRAVTAALPANVNKASVSIDFEHGKSDVAIVVHEQLGYKRELTQRDYRARFERDGIAARIVEALPKATWKGSVEVIEDEDPENVTDFEAAWDDLNKRLKIVSVLKRADIVSRLGRYAVVLMIAPGDVSSELPRGKRLTALRVFAEDDAKIASYDIDPNSPRFGMPTAYVLSRSQITGNAGVSPVLGRTAHWSRVFHIAPDILDDEVFGRPALQRSWNRFDDLEKITGGGAEAYWLRANRGTQIDIDPEIELDEPEEAALDEQVEKYKHNITRFLKTRGATINNLGSDVADFSNSADAVLTQVAGGEGIPKRILLGAEAGQLASSQDRSNWRDQVQDRREEQAEAQVLRPFIDHLIAFGYLPTPDSYEVRWPTVQFMDDMERADVAGKLATASASMATSQGEPLITSSEIRDRYLLLPPLDMNDSAMTDDELREDGGTDPEDTMTEDPDDPNAGIRTAAYIPDQDRVKGRWAPMLRKLDRMDHAALRKTDTKPELTERLRRLSMSPLTLTMDQKNAVSYFIEDDGRALNKALRSHTVTIPQAFVARVLDRAISLSIVSDDWLVYRAGALGDDTASRAPGYTFTDPAYISTTADPEVASSYPGPRYEIEIPKGATALYVASGRKAFDPAYEVVLPRDSSFTVVSTRDEGGVQITRVRMLR
jgi:hypothetical protein